MAEEELDSSAPSCILLVSAFLAMEPPDCLISLARFCGGGSITERVQRFIWVHCISKADENFHSPYVKRFLKKLILEVESTGAVVLDEIYEQYATFMTFLKDDDSAPKNSRILKWVSFLFPGDYLGAATFLKSRKLVIPLHCSLNLLEGDTGCSIWPSSLFLSEFILSFPEIFSNKSCFEVGSGVGLVGICLAHVRASKVILSDGDLSSLINMKLNLDLNKSSVKFDLLEASSEDENLVQCKYLPWESAPESELRDYTPDIVLGADVIYDPLCIPHLVRVLAILLKRQKSCSNDLENSHSRDVWDNFEQSVQNGEMNGALERKEFLSSHLEMSDLKGYNTEVDGSRGTLQCSSIRSPMYWCQASKEEPVAYIASVIRNIDTFNCFLTQAEQANLRVTDLSAEIKVLDLLPYMQCFKQSNVRLFSISLPCK